MQPVVEKYEAPEWIPEEAVVPSSRLRMARLPTPIEPFACPGLPTGIRMWIKRDDLTGALLSGNKIRKLDFLLAEAIAGGHDTVVTCGGIQSNHCRATAVAAARLGLGSVLLLRTREPQVADPGLVGNLLLDRMVGAKIKLITWEQYQHRGRLMEELAEDLRQQGKRPYVIPEGGSNGVGSWGYVEAARELAEQTRASGMEFDDLVLACGSAGTSAGLGVGLKLAGESTSVRAVPVCNDAEYFHTRIDQILEQLGLGEVASSRGQVELLDGHKGLGYAKSTSEEIRFLREVALATGIVLDPVYTGKALRGFLRECKRDPERFGPQVLFLHTGGVFGLFDKVELLQPELDDWRH